MPKEEHKAPENHDEDNTPVQILVMTHKGFAKAQTRNLITKLNKGALVYGIEGHNMDQAGGGEA